MVKVWISKMLENKIDRSSVTFKTVNNTSSVRDIP